MKKIFADMESVSTFAVSYIVIGKRKPATNFATGIFYALTILYNITAVTPVWSINVPTAYDRCKTTGKDSRFSVHNATKSVLHMASEIQLFSNPQFGEIRTIITEDGRLMFVASDVAKALGYAVPQKAVSTHCKHCSKMEHPINRGTIINIIPESDLYRLTMKSKLPNAEVFQNWVCGEVLPSIRQTGTYSIQQQFAIPSSFGEALMLAAQQQIQIENQQKQLVQKEQELTDLKAENVELQKQSEYTCIILQSKKTVLVTQIAQDYGMSARRFNALLRDLKIQHKVRNQWILYGKFLNKGYVHSSTHNYTHSNGEQDVCINTEWTQKGRLFLYEQLKKNGILPLIEK